MPQRIASIGECMIELSHGGGNSLSLAYGGDTLNTAIYLKRVAGEALAVDYVTALGKDPWSESMLDSWRSEGIGTGLVTTLEGRLPGLYIIRVDDKGERRFYYWRSASAARQLFTAPETLRALNALPAYGLLYFSLITISILESDARSRLFEQLAAARRAKRIVAFDTNYRPAGWPDRETAAREVRRFMDVTTLGLPTFDDEQKLFDDKDPAETARRWRSCGVAELAVKLGGDGCLLAADGIEDHVRIPEPVEPVDTTAAGDAFHAAYMAARLAGHGVTDAARAGHRVAGAVVQHRGAIIPREATPSLADALD